MTSENLSVGLILKSEPEMAGIYRWAHDLLTVLSPAMSITQHEVASPNSFYHKHALYPLGNILGKDIKTAYRNYPATFENPNHVQPKLWHIGSQTFGRIFEHLKQPSVVTVFDLYPLIFNTFGSKKDENGYLRAVRNIPRSDFILTLSQSAKSEIVQCLEVSPQKVRVIPAGISDSFAPQTVKRDPLQIVYVGSELPRKNLTRLFEALAIVFKQIPNAHFIKVGRPQWAGTRNHFQQLIKKLGIEKNVKFIDYVQDLPAFYSSSGLSVQVSTHEGFGYPVIEAMACGVPTVISDIPSLTELSNGNSIVVDPFEPSKIAQGIIKVLESKTLQEDLIQKGLQRREDYRFTLWQHEMIRFYSHACLELGL